MNSNITNEILKKYAKMASQSFMTNPGYVISCPDEKKRQDFIYHVVLMRLYISRKTDIFYFDEEGRGLLVLRKAGLGYPTGEVLKVPNILGLLKNMSFVSKLLGVTGAFSDKGLYDEEKTYIVSPVFVDVNHQGKGVGTALLKKAVEDMAQKGFKVGLDTMEPTNVPYYEKLGFKLIDTQFSEKDNAYSWYMVYE
ncbi:MAG: GNAT family N-acetyltransferase [Oscillospiraceae bacterium]|nr:GNAT family N-acetyltransferase [Oscillospiraceae bacterium]